MIRRLLHALRRLSPNCRQAAHLISDATERELSLLDRLGLWLHLLICRACRGYQSSIHILRVLMRTAAGSPPASGGQDMPDEAKERILRKLRDR
jgi:hypothetical protein